MGCHSGPPGFNNYPLRCKQTGWRRGARIEGFPRAPLRWSRRSASTCRIMRYPRTLRHPNFRGSEPPNLGDGRTSRGPPQKQGGTTSPIFRLPAEVDMSECANRQPDESAAGCSRRTGDGPQQRGSSNEKNTHRWCSPPSGATTPDSATRQSVPSDHHGAESADQLRGHGQHDRWSRSGRRLGVGLPRPGGRLPDLVSGLRRQPRRTLYRPERPQLRPRGRDRVRRVAAGGLPRPTYPDEFFYALADSDIVATPGCAGTAPGKALGADWRWRAPSSTGDRQPVTRWSSAASASA